jgi:predicted RNA-binding Zn ribbon-like protein
LSVTAYTRGVLPTWVPDIESKPAPGELLLLQAFVNTFEGDTGLDLLGEQESANRWLHDSGLVPADVELDAPSLARLRAVREAFRCLLAFNAGLDEPDPSVLDAVTEALDGSGLELGLSVAAGDRYRVLAAPSGHDPVGMAVVRLMLIMREAQLERTWERLKACSRPECRWAYYDRSHSQKGRWCDMATCGNRVKNQALRTRRQLEGGTHPRA